MSAALLAALIVASPIGGLQSSGARFIDAADAVGTVTAADSFDISAPSIDSSAIVRGGGSIAGFIRPGGTYEVYANVTDAGAGATGVAEVTADLSGITSGQTSVALVPGSYSAGGVAYGFRSSSLTADAGLPDGVHTYTVRASDAAGNPAAPATFTVTVDATAPVGVDVQIVNGASTAGRPEAGDSITFTFSEPIDPTSVLTGWTGSSTAVVVRISDGGLIGSDVLTVRDATNAVQLPLGSVDLGAASYVSTTRDFGAGGTASTLTASGSTVTVVLGTPSGSTGTELAGAHMAWSPSSSALDRAGNGCQTTSVTESGSLVDPEF